MNPSERIKRHRETIANIREDIEWIKATQFSINEKTSDDIVEQQSNLILLYEMLIERLSKGSH